MNRPTVFGVPIFVDDQAPPNRIALMDVAGSVPVARSACTQN